MWTIHYRVSRDRVLDAREREKLGEIVRRANQELDQREPFRIQYAVDARADGVIAWGLTGLGKRTDPVSFAGDDLDTLLAGLSSMRELLGDARTEVIDERRLVRWDAQLWSYSMSHGEPVAAAPPVAWVEGAPYITELQPSGDREIIRLLKALAAGEDSAAAGAALARLDPHLVLEVGLPLAFDLIDQEGYRAAIASIADELDRLGELGRSELAIASAFKRGVPSADRWPLFLAMLGPATRLDGSGGHAAEGLCDDGHSDAERRIAFARFLRGTTLPFAVKQLVARARMDRDRPAHEVPWRDAVQEALASVDPDLRAAYTSEA